VAIIQSVNYCILW